MYLTSSESRKLSTLIRAPVYVASTVSRPKASTRHPTNFGLATTRTKRGYRRSLDAFTATSLLSLSAKNFNFESNTPLTLNPAVWDGGLNDGTKSLPFPRTRVSNTSDVDGEGIRRESDAEEEGEGGREFDSTSGSGSLPTMWSRRSSILSTSSKRKRPHPAPLSIHQYLYQTVKTCKDVELDFLELAKHKQKLEFQIPLPPPLLFARNFPLSYFPTIVAGLGLLGAYFKRVGSDLHLIYGYGLYRDNEEQEGEADVIVGPNLIIRLTVFDHGVAQELPQ